MHTGNAHIRCATCHQTSCNRKIYIKQFPFSFTPHLVGVHFTCLMFQLTKSCLYLCRLPLSNHINFLCNFTAIVRYSDYTVEKLQYWFAANPYYLREREKHYNEKLVKTGDCRYWQICMILIIHYQNKRHFLISHTQCYFLRHW